MRVPIRNPLGDEAAAARAAFVIELSGENEIAVAVSVQIVGKDGAGRIRDIGNRAGVHAAAG